MTWLSTWLSQTWGGQSNFSQHPSTWWHSAAKNAAQSGSLKHAGSPVLCDAPALHLSNLFPGKIWDFYGFFACPGESISRHNCDSSPCQLNFLDTFSQELHCPNLLGNLQSCLVLKFEAESHHVRLGKSSLKCHKMSQNVNFDVTRWVCLKM